jgi:hypothetical protein
MYSCQKDDEINSTDTVNLDIENENLITSTNSLKNGQVFVLRAEINNTRVVDYSVFKIRNISNENVIITLNDFGDLSIRTNSASEQSFSFEIYHNEKKMRSFSSNVKPQFNLIDNTNLIDGPLLLNANYDNQSFEYKLVKSNASPIQNFNIRDISLRQSLNAIHFDDHIVLPGNNFKIIFNLNNSGNQTTSLYYNYKSDPIFVKDIIITNNLNTSPSKFSCSTITNKMFSSRVGETLGRPREATQYYVGKNNIIGSESLNFINTERQFIYNTNNKLSQVLDMFSKKVLRTYEYMPNGLIKQSNSFQRDNTIRFFRKYYYDDTSQNLIAEVNGFENTEGIQLIDSTANSNFVNNKPTRIVEYNFENTLIPTGPIDLTFFRVSYENNGNTIRKEISLDDVNYVLSTEEKFSPNDKVLVPFNSSTGEVLVEKPLLIESKIFADYKAEPVNSPSIRTLDKVERDDNNNIIYTEHILESKYNFINELIFTKDNEDCL